MIKLNIYQIDAFAECRFEGNPAAVVPLDYWLPEAIMQNIAAENNLAETAFFVPTESGFYIRWFTPAKEVRLCGHATLASAYVLFFYFHYGAKIIEFSSLSGPLFVRKKGELLELDFPAQPPKQIEVPENLAAALGVTPIECWVEQDLIVILDSESDVVNVQPHLEKLKAFDWRGVIVTARSNTYDFVCRMFAPKYGINEDPVTGSAYTQLAPYWGERLQKTCLVAKQESSRGGIVFNELAGDRVLISGKAVPYLEGVIYIDDISDDEPALA